MSDAPETTGTQRPRLQRTRRGRLIGGVCTGLSVQLGIDALLVRIVFVGLALFAGVGFWLYLAILLLVPEEGANRAPIRLRRSSLPWIAGVVALAAAAGLALSAIEYGSLSSAWKVAGLFGVITAVGVAAGFVRHRVRAALRRTDGASADLRMVSNLALVTAIVAQTTLLALAGAWLGGIDHSVAAWAVVAAGAALVIGSFLRARRLLAPPLAFALAVAVFAAAGVDLHGGIGNRVYRPHTVSDLRAGYRLGVGRLEVDLRDVAFPAGSTTPLHVRLGVGEEVVVVPDEVCVATRARLGGGFAGALDRQTQGLDVDWSERPARPHRAPTLLLEGRVGLGALFVVDRPLTSRYERGLYGTNAACRDSIGAAG